MKKVSRRAFISTLSAATAIIASNLEASASTVGGSTLDDGDSDRKRLKAAQRTRQKGSDATFRKPAAKQRSNSDLKKYGRDASFTKGMPHNEFGLVSKRSFDQLTRAIRSGKQEDFENIVMGGPKRFKNPMAAFAFDTQGYDSSQLSLPPAPSINSSETSAEMIELYWKALCRDINFSDFDSFEETGAAARELTTLAAYKGPKLNGSIPAQYLFRLNLPGVLDGPYISQLLYREVPSWSQTISQLQRTLVPGKDYLTDYRFFAAAQNGFIPGVPEYDTTKRYIRNGRDLAHYMHLDWIFQAFLHAALILKFDLKAPFDNGNPYVASSTMDGFGTFDYPHLLTLVSEVTTRALKACWYQKWVVHRRIRPEEIGGLVHNKVTQGIDAPISDILLNSEALSRTFIKNGSYLLPQVYPEGAPGHPAYPSGHATVAGACATILKAWFDESYVFPEAYTPSADGTVLNSYTASSLTVGNEINKLAANQASGRLWGGVHFTSDSTQGILLGEQVAIGLLKEQALTYPEKDWSFSITRFNGRRIRIRG